MRLFFIYPNPIGSNNKLSDKIDAFNYMIYNVIGGLVKKGKLSTSLNKLDVETIGFGIYVIRMTSGR